MPPSPSDHLPTDWRHELQNGDIQHAQRQIQQELQQNINLSHPLRGAPFRSVASKPVVRKPLLSKSIHNSLIKQERQDADTNDAVRIKMRFVIPFRDDDLLEKITDSTQ